tara:strand:+ start:675 stop:1403 length:729 start_codon:yes stop_codon:yes gene_type:complete
MSRTKVSEWDSSASANTDINGININEGCPPSTLNNMGREIMSQIKNWQDGSSGDSATNSGTLTSSGTLAITGNVTLDGAAGTSGQYLTSAGSGTPTWVTPTLEFVSGMIMLWSGSEASIPVGWLLCDGTSSTPNLQDRFVVGAGNTYAVGATGGSADAVVVSHTHTATVTDPGHRHGYAYNGRLTYAGGGGNPNTLPTSDLRTDYSTNNATTGITVANSTTGVSGTNANLPPYYALCYIMKS